MSNRNLYTFIFGSMAGILAGAYFDIPVIFLLASLGIVFIIFIINYFLKKNSQKFLYYVLILASISFGILMYKNSQGPTDFKYNFGDAIRIEGNVIDDPISKNTYTTFTLRHENDYFLVRTKNPIEIHYGDNLLIEGVLEEPKNFMTDQGKEFDYVSYLEVKNIHSIISKASIIEIYGNTGNPIKKTLINIKNNVEFVYSSVFSPKESGLLNGIMLGAKEGISEDTRNEFIRTGTIHIVALSGYNVTIVAEGIMKFFGIFLAKSISTVGGILGILLFVIMTGLQTSAIRAGIMASLLLFARYIGRPYIASRILFITGFVMVLLNPPILIDDVSFQLSFLATLGIIYIDPIIKPGLVWIKNNFLISTLSATLSAQIAVFPFILYKMGTLSVISPIANIMILPIIPIIMFLGLGVYILGVIYIQISIPLAFILHVLLQYIFKVVNIGSNFSFSSLTFPHASIIFILVLYSLIFFWVYTKHQNRLYSAIL